MLVYLHQYREGDSGNAREGESVDRSTEEYFDVDGLELDEWERLEQEGQNLQRRARQFDEVTAVSVPQEETHPDVPGMTIQLRIGGDQTYVDNAELIEIQDPNP